MVIACYVGWVERSDTHLVESYETNFAEAIFHRLTTRKHLLALTDGYRFARPILRWRR
jgi:hypothetical protein